LSPELTVFERPFSSWHDRAPKQAPSPDSRAKRISLGPH
jgi:hypothetical protein